VFVCRRVFEPLPPLVTVLLPPLLVVVLVPGQGKVLVLMLRPF
jgi:hypothetical protein